MTWSNQEAIDFTTRVFDSIKKSNTIFDLESIPDQLNIPNQMNVITYPKIGFSIRPEEIQKMIDNNILDSQLNFHIDIMSKLNDPFSKLLYATAWKNGDLTKIKHIIKGILDAETEINEQDEALVFYQFGKYLTKTPGQPIIDQHVIRAFAVYTSTDNEKITTFRKLEILDKRHKSLIADYKNWLISDNLTAELKANTEYAYYIDKLLFAAGKTIKLRKKQFAS